MERDELIRRITALPVGTDVGVELGEAQLDIADVAVRPGTPYGVLRCLNADVRDVLAEWGLPESLRDRLAPMPPAAPEPS